MKFIWAPTIAGKAYCYYRRQSCAVRLTAADGSHPLEGDPGFQAAYDAVHDTFSVRERKPAKVAPATHSLSALIRSYLASDHYRDLAPVTQTAYARLFRLLEKSYGDADVLRLDRVRVQAIQTKFAVKAFFARMIRPPCRRAADPSTPLVQLRQQLPPNGPAQPGLVFLVSAPLPCVAKLARQHFIQSGLKLLLHGRRDSSRDGRPQGSDRAFDVQQFSFWF